MGKVLIAIGLCVVLIGILMVYKIYIPFGHLPGDLVIKGKTFQFYFPIVTSILVSIFLSILFYFFMGK